MAILNNKFATSLWPIAVFAPASAYAQPSVNYDDLASLEEPLAFEIGAATVEVKGVVDVPVTLEIEDGVHFGDVGVGFTGNFEVNAEMQLGNRWNVGVAYFGQYAENVDDYTDNVAGYIRTSWGTLVGGNVGGLVRESTRRRRGVGHAALAYDDFYGSIGRWGGGYSGRFGPVIVTGIVDGDGDFEVGAEYQRPLGSKDYRFATRFGRSHYLTPDGLANLQTTSVGAVGEVIFGSSLFDLGISYENFDGGGINVDRWFVSGGGQTKVGSFSLSAGGHYGELDGTSEASAAVGIGYDIARGLSTNLGLNARRARVARGGIQIIDDEETSATASVRYSF
ncbi:MAG: hypothetical protein V3V15_08560 [Sphingorhabdus sp.]